MFNTKLIIVTPWFESFAGGAEVLAKGMAREFDKRGVPTMVFTTCSRSPYDSWWTDYYTPGVYDVAGIETRRFATGEGQSRYQAVTSRLQRGASLTTRDEHDFFECGINSEALVDALGKFVDSDFEILALPYFQGLTHSVINRYPGKISLVPCFHDEPQFYWGTTKTLLRNAKHVFFNSTEEKQMTIKHYGRSVGRRIVESVVAGVGVELAMAEEEESGGPEDLPNSYFIFAGRKEAGKNVPLLCEWFQSYAEGIGHGTKLVFIGGGDEALVPANSHFIDFGFVSEARKQYLISHSKGVINLSLNESFSLVIMEGWLLGVPAVVSAGCAVTTNHVSKCDGGIYVANSDEFRRGLRYLEDQKALSNKMAANGKRYVSQEFSYDRVLKNYLRVFREGLQDG